MPSGGDVQDAVPLAPAPGHAPAPSGAWAAGPPPFSASAAQQHAPATPTTSVGGLGAESATDATPGGGIRLASGSRGGSAVFDVAVFKSIIDESVQAGIHAATAPLHEELGALRERVALAESRVDSESESSSESDESSSVGTLDEL